MTQCWCVRVDAAGKKSPPQLEEVLRPVFLSDPEHNSDSSCVWVVILLNAKIFLNAMTIHYLFLFGSLLEVLLSIWITWYVSCDFQPCKDFGVHLTRHLAVACTECRDKQGGLQSCPNARHLDLTYTHISTLLLLVARVLCYDEEGTKFGLPFLFQSYTWEAECMRFSERTFLFREYGPCKLYAFSTIYTHRYVYIYKMSVYMCLCVCVFV